MLAFNHHSYLDFLMVGWPVVRQLGRPLRFLAKREIWASRKVGWAVRWAEAVPVDRGSPAARERAFDAAVEALQAGDLVGVAPEQTISASFELLPLRTGAARMAQLAGVPIVPVAGWGTQRVLAKGGHRQLRTRLPVTVRFGPPIRVGPEDDPTAATEQLRERMAALLDQVQRGYPDGIPAGAPWVPQRLGGGAPAHAQVLREHRERERGWQPSAAPHPEHRDVQDGRSTEFEGGREDGDER